LGSIQIAITGSENSLANVFPNQFGRLAPLSKIEICVLYAVVAPQSRVKNDNLFKSLWRVDFLFGFIISHAASG
jgi:hypothetical protein